jgi:hypothetical protein
MRLLILFFALLLPLQFVDLGIFERLLKEVR